MDKIPKKVSQGSVSDSEMHSSDTEGELSDSEIYSADNEDMFSEVDESRPASPTPLASPVQATSLGFFNQPIHLPQQVQLTLEPNAFLLLAALVDELKTRNMIELTKMKLEAEQKKQEAEAAKKMEAEDKEHFEELRTTLYL